MASAASYCSCCPHWRMSILCSRDWEECGRRTRVVTAIVAGQARTRKHVCIVDPWASRACFAVPLPGIATALRGTRLRGLCWRGGKGREKPMAQTSKELAVKLKKSAHTFAHIQQGSNGDFTLESMESL